jgi:hypothetical protein
MNDQEQNYQSEQPESPFIDEPSEEVFKKEDKRYDKNHDRDQLSSLAWALILIWAGLVFLAANLGMLDRIQAQEIEFGGFNIMGLSTWSVIFVGAGAIVFLEAIIRTFVPAYRGSTGGNFFLAAIFLGIGLGGIFGWQLVWPFILIAMGLSALASALIQNRK